MITPDYARTMAAYNAEVNQRIFSAASRLSDITRREDGGVFWRSIHGTLCHILWADQMWLSRFGGFAASQAELKGSDKIVSDFVELWDHRKDHDKVILDWASSLSIADLSGDIRWFSEVVKRDVVKSKAIAVIHFFNHQTHHRGQVHALITRFGEATGDIDLTFVP